VGLRLSNRVFLGFSAVLLVSACASTGATLGSGVGDAMLERAPWVAGRPLPTDRGPLLVLPVAWQAGATHPAFAEPKATGDSPVALLLADLQRTLDAAALGPAASVPASRDAVPPDVHSGCRMLGAVCEPSLVALSASRREMRHHLGVGRPSSAWTQALADTLDAHGARHALLVTMEIGQYLPRQRGLAANKYVVLGRDHEQALPWLTSVEEPVAVLQLTGVVVDRAGKAVRIAAEGMQAKRTPLLLSAIDAQALLRDDDVTALRTRRREDLPGQPFVWEAALLALLTDLGVR
jgi:hypothetical protein